MTLFPCKVPGEESDMLRIHDDPVIIVTFRVRVVFSSHKNKHASQDRDGIISYQVNNRLSSVGALGLASLPADRVRKE